MFAWGHIVSLCMFALGQIISLWMFALGHILRLCMSALGNVQRLRSKQMHDKTFNRLTKCDVVCPPS